MTRAWNRLRENRSHEYAPLPLSEKEACPEFKQRRQNPRFTVLGLVMSIAICLFALYGLVT